MIELRFYLDISEKILVLEDYSIKKKHVPGPTSLRSEKMYQPQFGILPIPKIPLSLSQPNLLIDHQTAYDHFGLLIGSKLEWKNIEIGLDERKSK